VEQVRLFREIYFPKQSRPRARGVIAVWLCSVKNERFWDELKSVSKRRKMAVFVCQNPSQNQSAKTCTVLGFRFFRFRSFLRMSNSSSFPFFKALDSFDSAADNQGTNAPRLFVLSVFFLCFGSGFCFVSISSLSHLSLIFSLFFLCFVSAFSLLSP
jgi:hypothetical protein